MIFRFSLVLSAFTFISTSGFSQIIVDNSITVSELVLDSLPDNSISISNIFFNGTPGDQVYSNIGALDANTSNLPFNYGLVMASGNSEIIIGPNNSGSTSMNGDAPIYDDDDLDSIATGITNDESILEFDFIPTGNFISLNYSFMSEEYNEYVCAIVNDAFAIFLSGPGIDGPYSNNGINIALIPNTDMPVSINTVNIGEAGSSGNIDNCTEAGLANSAYFIDNQSNTDPLATQMDGFTVSMFPSSPVQSGESYHLKIAICNVLDGAFDSAVILKSRSFRSIMVDPLTIDQYEKENVFNIFPNPASDFIMITSVLDMSISKIVIYNQMGQEIIAATNTNRMDVSQLAKGIYILELHSNDKRYRNRIIIE